MTVLAAREHTTGFALGYDGREYESSSGGNTNYLTNVWIVQTGDTLELHYASSIHSREEEFEQRKAGRLKDDEVNSPPKILKSGFSFDPTWSYNAWIKEYLPH